MLDFDFVINKDLFEKIKSLKEKTNIGLSKLIREIIIFMIPFLRKKHLFEKRREKDYKIINATHKIRVYLPKEVYNELKMVHDQINSFSIATLVRELLETYFSGIENYGEKNFINIVSKLKKIIEGLKEKKTRLVKSGATDIPFPLEEEDYFWLKFKSNFTLKEIKFL
ncbi:MAG TPA: hypothetical protein PK351_09545 [Spirochaetota bacterium]|nr:hypothetical protein [Spirochaetota bacterium]HPP05050.1 hypothetical protein [Spirochaetota bacterium]